MSEMEHGEPSEIVAVPVVSQSVLRRWALQMEAEAAADEGEPSE